MAMLTLLLSTVLAAAPASTGIVDAVVATDADASGLQLPTLVTASGRQFIARCDDEAFAASRRPKALAERCGRLLAYWQLEVRNRVEDNRSAEWVHFGAPRGIPRQPPVGG